MLLFFMSSCHVCHGMIPEWNRAYAGRAAGVNVLGVMIDEAPPDSWTSSRSPSRS